MRHLPNEMLYRLKEALHLSLEEIVTIYKSQSYPLTPEAIRTRLLRHQDRAFTPASYEDLGVFLDGLIAFKRGDSPHRPSEEMTLSNNLILKKLRIALELKESEVEIIFGLADIALSKQQLSSLFRKESHKNFKACSDTLLLAFIEGLDEFFYEGDS
jgi:uncharacterized protein YehS (DUF1456 family)